MGVDRTRDSDKGYIALIKLLEGELLHYLTSEMQRRWRILELLVTRSLIAATTYNPDDFLVS